MNNLKVLVVEDEEHARVAIISELKLRYPQLTSIVEASSVKEGLQMIKQHNPDLVLMDIQLSDGFGFDILETLEQIDFSIIFTTAHSEYAIRAFKFNALDYLLKPIDGNDLKKSIDKVLGNKQKGVIEALSNYFYNLNAKPESRRIALQTSNGIYIHEIHEIIRVHAMGNYVQFIFSGNRKLMVAKTLGEYEDTLQPFGFIRVHHAHLVNVKHLVSYHSKDGSVVTLSDGESVPVSSRKRKELLNYFDNLNLI